MGLDRASAGARGVRGRSAFAALLAGCLALILAGQTVAATFSTPTMVNAPGTRVFDDVDLAVLNSSTAVAAYPQYDGTRNDLFIRRTTDAGSTWSSPLLRISSAHNPSLAGLGTAVDVVFNRPDGSVWYTRSNDSGLTYSLARPISPGGRYAWFPEVARGPGNVVAIVWTDVAARDVFVTVSDDGGASFGSPTRLTGRAGSGGLAVAVGSGVIYAAYSNRYNRPILRSSTDGGVTWSAPPLLKNKLRSHVISLTALDRSAVVAYVTGGSSGQPVVRYRFTTDGGGTWSGQQALSPPAWHSISPDLALDGQGLRAVFTRCDADGTRCRVMYSQATDTVTWTWPLRVSPKGLSDAFAPHVSLAGTRMLFIYIGVRSGNENAYVRYGAISK